MPEGRIRIQSSEQKELAGENLLDEMSPVRWIITKDALKEGWDCSFAYLLALLDNTKAKTAVTQMLGRVMRQPQAQAVDKNALLNRCYVYCYNEEVGKVVQWVRAGLEKEGLTGLGNAVVGGAGGADLEPRTIERSETYRKLDIFLPQVLHSCGAKWRPLDYDRDILGALDWSAIDAGEAELNDGETTSEIKAVVDIQGESRTSKSEINTGESVTLDYFVRRLIDSVPNPWQAARIAERFIEKHKGECDARLLQSRTHLAEVLRRRVNEEIDKKAERVFRDKINNDEIRFRLVTDKKLNYELQKTLEVSVANDEQPLARSGRALQRSLFEDVFDSEFNTFERDFALYLDKNDAIYWWHRIAARREYALQGWRRHRVYPDFIACKQDSKLLILETKGEHLKGNEDTEYKKNLLQTLEATYKTALDRGEMKILGDTPATFRMLFEQDWKERMNSLLAEDHRPQ